VNVHDGHRKRIKDRFVNFGLESFQEHEVLELLLFYAIPRGDVNPIAHELISKFGSFGRTL
jgi:DNA repair protein RadC